MSRNANINTPVTLGIKGREELLSEPVLVEMCEQQQQVHSLWLLWLLKLYMHPWQLLTKAKEIDIDLKDEEEKAAAIAMVKDICKQATKVHQKHDVIVLCETAAQVEHAQSDYFKGASGHQLQSEVHYKHHWLYMTC